MTAATFACVLLLLLVHVSLVATLDFHRLVQVWPMAFCSTSKKPCMRIPPHRFTLHGLWPQDYGQPLEYCSTTSPYSKISDQNLIQRLDYDWPNLTQANPHGPEGQWFWQHEWTRHGTCSSTPNDQNAYFNMALGINAYDILNILLRNGIRPGVCLPWGTQTVSYYQVNASIVGAVGKLVQICCVRSSNKNLPGYVLKKVVICYDNNGTSIIDCPNPYDKLCSKNQGNIYFL